MNASARHSASTPIVPVGLRGGSGTVASAWCTRMLMASPRMRTKTPRQRRRKGAGAVGKAVGTGWQSVRRRCCRLQNAVGGGSWGKADGSQARHTERVCVEGVTVPALCNPCSPARVCLHVPASGGRRGGTRRGARARGASAASDRTRRRRRCTSGAGLRTLSDRQGKGGASATSDPPRSRGPAA